MLTSRLRKRATSAAPPFYKAIKKAAYKEAVAQIQVVEEQSNGQLLYGLMNTLLSDLYASGITDATHAIVSFHRTKGESFSFLYSCTSKSSCQHSVHSREWDRANSLSLKHSVRHKQEAGRFRGTIHIAKKEM